MSEPPAEAEAPPQQEVQQDDAPAGPARDPILEKVYDSIVPMPLVELFPGVRLSPVIIGCVPPKDTKVSNYTCRAHVTYAGVLPGARGGPLGCNRR